jgi:hypothetical protein
LKLFSYEVRSLGEEIADDLSKVPSGSIIEWRSVEYGKKEVKIHATMIFGVVGACGREISFFWGVFSCVNFIQIFSDLTLACFDEVFLGHVRFRFEELRNNGLVLSRKDFSANVWVPSVRVRHS